MTPLIITYIHYAEAYMIPLNLKPGRGRLSLPILFPLSFLLIVLRVFIGLYGLLCAGYINAAHVHAYLMLFYTNAAYMHHGGAGRDYFIVCLLPFMVYLGM